MKKRFTTNARVINDLFAQYKDTFAAFCELTNNSIQSGSKNIFIDIEKTPENELSPTLIRKLVIKDDGVGVCEADFERTILNIGTDSKKGGKGIGRFAALQIGSLAEIETIGFNSHTKLFSKVKLEINEAMFSAQSDVSALELDIKEEFMGGKHATYYQVSIHNLYDFTRTEKEKRKKYSELLLEGAIEKALFETYSTPIFNKDVKFHVNGVYVDPANFVIGEPERTLLKYSDKKGDEHDVHFASFQINSSRDQVIKVFLTLENAGINTVAYSFNFKADWLSPRLGSFFVYIDSKYFTGDMLRNFDFSEMDENGKHVRAFIKDSLNSFFKEKNRVFDGFREMLKQDEYYPYHNHSASSSSKVMVFDKVAYLIEDKYKLLSNSNDLRELIYPLVDKSISNGNFNEILGEILKLDDDYINRFNNLLNESSLEDVISFSEKVVHKLQDLDFLYQLTYGDVSKHLLERKQLHKVLEHKLWVFGERYNETTTLYSDKNLEANLRKLAADCLEFEADKKNENLSDVPDDLKLITDLFMYSERIIDEDKKEVMVVELKAPKVKISKKELQQAKDYAYEIDQRGIYSKDLIYKIILVGSDFTKQTSEELKSTSASKRNNPYFYFENAAKNIEVWVVKWSDIIEQNRRRLTYMSNILKVKDIDVKARFEEDFDKINIDNLKSTLTKSSNNL